MNPLRYISQCQAFRSAGRQHQSVFIEDMLELPIKYLLRSMQNRICTQSSYFGIPTQKCPNDYWVYQELLVELRPDIIIEIGNYHGGSCLAFAHLCDVLGKGSVIGIDIDHSHLSPTARQHARIQFLCGDACALLPKVRSLVPPNATVFVIEDSSHTYENTLEVLRVYSDFVTPGSYLVVEDGLLCHGLPFPSKKGPYEAVEAFLAENNLFELDRSRESFLLTWNPKGFLRRKQPVAK